MEAYLVKRREDVICKLNFGNGCMPHCRHTDAKPSYSLFGERGIEYAFFACLFMMSAAVEARRLLQDKPNSSAKPYSATVSSQEYEEGTSQHTIVHLNTPPKATSSPKTMAVSSFVRAMAIASRTAW